MGPKADLALSIVIPVYKDVASLGKICDQFEACIPAAETYELIFVNDGNVANDVYEALQNLRQKSQVRVIHLSRNFGQHTAIAAGLKNAAGRFILVMDSDLQYMPSDCYDFYCHARDQGHAALLSVIPQRSHHFLKKITARLYYGFMRFLGTPLKGNLGSIFVVSQHVAKGLARIHDRSRITIPMIYWLWGDIAMKEIAHHPRRFGKSSYTLPKLIWHALNGVTSFSAKPLYLSICIAVLFAASASGIMLYYLVQRFWLGQTYFPGWLSNIFVVLISSSVILACLGIIGIYIARMFESTNGRPLYYVQEENATDTKLFEDP